MTEYGLRVLARSPYSALELGRGREQVAHAYKRKGKEMKELLLEKFNTELNKVIEEITPLKLNDEMIPTLCGWELALKWAIQQVEEVSE